MKTVMRPRYYCDHCKKASGSPSAMIRHERGCTANPIRLCRMCGAGYVPVKVHTDILVKAPLPTTTEAWKVRMGLLRKATMNCPCCILAAIRQSGLQKTDPDPETGFCGLFYEAKFWDNKMFGFGFKSERDSYLRERTESDNEVFNGD